MLTPPPNDLFVTYVQAKLAKRDPYEDKDVEESDFEWPKLWFSKSLFWIIFPNFFVMSFSA